jgi:hypothetical protein
MRIDLRRILLFGCLPGFRSGYRVSEAAIQYHLGGVMTGASLRAARLAAGISLRALAGRTGISPTYLCDIEQGRRPGNGERGGEPWLTILWSDLRRLVAEQKARKERWR